MLKLKKKMRKLIKIKGKSAKKREKITDLKALVQELALADISKEEIIACIEEVYHNK